MKSQAASLLIVSALCLAAVACEFGATGATPTPQPTSMPTTAIANTATPLASATPEPSATCCTPSPEPQGTATPDPNLGVGDSLYEDNFDGQSGWNWSPPPDGIVVWNIESNQLNAVMQTNFGARWNIRPDFSAGDQQIRVTAKTNLCYERDEYGLMFRGNELGTSAYVFKLNCGGGARVELIQDFQHSPLTEWTTNSAIVAGAPAENTLMVWMAQDQFHFYVNDNYIFSLKNSTFAEGVYGFYLRDRTNGGESISFSQLVAKEVKLP